MAARRPRQDDSVMHKIAPPTLPLPHSLRGSPHAIRDPTVPQLHVHVVDSIIPETEPDALSDDVQRLERRTKSRHDQPCEQKLTCGDDEVNGRLKQKKATYVPCHMRRTCVAPYMRGAYLRSGKLVDPIPGGVLNHWQPWILMPTLLISLVTRMTRVWNRRMVLRRHRRRGGRSPRLITFYEKLMRTLTEKIQVNGEGKNWVHLTEGAFQPGPGHPNEQGLVQRNVHLAWLSTF